MITFYPAEPFSEFIIIPSLVTFNLESNPLKEEFGLFVGCTLRCLRMG
jgi:hypothetical protein